MTAHLIQATARELSPSASGEPPEWILLMPPGPLAARDGRRWRNDDPAAVLAATRERAGGMDIVIDYEHQTDNAARNGQPAPAAGWIRELELEGGALWGRVEWTERGAEALVRREYRYLSPTFEYEKSSGQVSALLRAALTNNPALNLPALARADDDTDTNDNRGDDMSDITREQVVALAAALGLAETATPDEMTARAGELAAGAQGQAETLAPVATALGLASDASREEVVAAATTAKAAAPEPGAYVRREDFDALATRLAELQRGRTEEVATAAVDGAIASGKVSPSMREWALEYATADAQGFARYVEGAPVIVAPGGSETPPAQHDPNAPLSAEQVAMCNHLGITAEKFRESQAEIEGRSG